MDLGEEQTGPRQAPGGTPDSSKTPTHPPRHLPGTWYFLERILAFLFFKWHTRT